MLCSMARDILGAATRPSLPKTCNEFFESTNSNDQHNSVSEHAPTRELGSHHAGFRERFLSQEVNTKVGCETRRLSRSDPGNSQSPCQHHEAGTHTYTHTPHKKLDQTSAIANMFPGLVSGFNQSEHGSMWEWEESHSLTHSEQTRSMPTRNIRPASTNRV